MTPPDSDAVAICPSCRQRLNGLSPSCRYSTRHYVRHYVKPDSGERDVIHAQGCQSFYGESCDCIETPTVSLPSSLAQRILAHMAEVDSALGSDDWKPDQPLRATLRALMGELQERLPK